MMYPCHTYRVEVWSKSLYPPKQPWFVTVKAVDEEDAMIKAIDASWHVPAKAERID